MDYEKLSKEELIELLKESQDINKKLLDLMNMHNKKMTQISIQSLEEQINLRYGFLASLEEGMPPKFFKSARKEWQTRINETNLEIEDLQKKLYEEYAELGNSLSKIDKKNEDND